MSEIDLSGIARADAVAIIAAVTGESALALDTNDSRPAPEAIARVAYQLYEARGRQDGRDLEDWLFAEAQLTARP